MITYNSLEETSIKTIYRAFIEAFSDYQVDLGLNENKFNYMMKRRGLDLKVSIDAFDNNKLVGFVLNGSRLWNEQMTAYDLGTGVIKDYRNQGISSTIVTNVKELLRGNNIQQYEMIMEL